MMMNYPVPYVVLKKSCVKNDWKLTIKPQNKNNGRKVLVNEIFPARELHIEDPQWQAGPTGGKTPVVETGFGGVEIATFTHEAGQDWHKHLIGTEIYTVLEGIMAIRVEYQDQHQDIELEAGDEIVILPNTIHKVHIENAREFLC